MVALEERKIISLEGVSGTALKLQVTLRRGNSESVSLHVRRSPDGRETTEIRYSWETGRLVLDRTASSLNPRVRRDMQEATYFPTIKDSIALTVFLDQSVLEVFVDERAAFATRIYPTLAGSDGIALACSGPGAVAGQIKAVRIRGPHSRSGI
jgi:beta-fructofuranosidase